MFFQFFPKFKNVKYHKVQPKMLYKNSEVKKYGSKLFATDLESIIYYYLYGKKNKLQGIILLLQFSKGV